MKIKVIGKVHREGTSKKTGNPYSFNQVFYNGHDRGVEGLASLSLNLDPGMYKYEDIVVGGEYDVEFGPRGLIAGFYPVGK